MHRHHAAAALLVIVGGLGGCGTDSTDDPGDPGADGRLFPTADQAYGAPRPTWAVGTTIHYGSEELRLPDGPPVSALLRTPSGFFVSRAENGGLAEDGFFDGDTYTVVEGGITDLALGEDSRYAAWAEVRDRTVVVADLADGTAAAVFDDLADVSLDAEDEDPEPPATAVLGFSDGRLWFRDEQEDTYAASTDEWRAVRTDEPAPERTTEAGPLVASSSPDGRYSRDVHDSRLVVVDGTTGAVVWEQSADQIEAAFLSWTDEGFLVSVSDGYVTEPGTHYLVQSCSTPDGDCSTLETVPADQRVVPDGWPAY